jgi:hypothetical protein
LLPEVLRLRSDNPNRHSREKAGIPAFFFNCVKGSGGISAFGE